MKFRHLALALGFGLISLNVLAQSYPNRSIRLIVPFPAGGATDLLARAISQKLGSQLGQTVLVDNKAGAGGSLGSSEGAKAAPDGYTLVLTTSSTHAIGPHLNPRLPYKVDEDFTPVAHVANAANVVLVPNSLPVKDVRELIALVKSKPGQYNYASSGNGTIVHLTSEAFKTQANVFITHIPYRGTGLAVPDLVVGNVHLLFDSIVSGMPHVKEGRLKALAVTGKSRSALAPELPTVAESGLPGFESITWFGVYGPKGLPPAVVAKLNSELNIAMQSPEVRERLARLGAEPVSNASPAQFAAMVKADSERWGRLIRERKISVE
ncbi:Bug family tripartite tricarboxylate transporter substrate binding protein [Paucibacter sp. XJ19-41]|uniref:Bug family tripartite tricarboxylate transporter substrate binding protein n=1 Tax=Paucibacter sp. XJ19-41 TaxID=2927824 RepID=UPI00234B21C5|nr:tripartite tricarboxylate transporter substrate binding protein [Paucibacter sp. XJ19-41]MDC6166238.1 tripartite tricarboxylate transporter substrate binding protein [Paucibacter sp. XJ19-41]